MLKLYDRTQQGICHKTPDVNEIVEGKLKKLPGCNPVTTTTAEAMAAAGTCPNLAVPKFFSSPTAYFGDVAPPGAFTLVPVFSVAATSTTDQLASTSQVLKSSLPPLGSSPPGQDGNTPAATTTPPDDNSSLRN